MLGLWHKTSTTWVIFRGGLHYGPWSQTIEDGLCEWSEFMVRISWSDFIKKIILRVFNPSLGVNRMGTKKNEHALKSEFVDLIIIHARKGQFRKKKVWPFSCLFLGFTCPTHASKSQLLSPMIPQILWFYIHSNRRWILLRRRKLKTCVQSWV